MLDIKQFGRKISELRNSYNMTQMELADKMNVTFQAVSNWERGNSMPDISKLPELAEIFHVTIDELCGRTSKILESAAKEELDGYLRKNDVTAEELCDVAPVLKGSQVEKIAQQALKLNVNKINELLPFLSRDVVNQLVQKVIDEEKDYDNIAGIFPFVDEETLVNIAQKMVEQNKLTSEIIPFLPKEKIGSMAEVIYEKNGIEGIAHIFPFLLKKDIEKIAVEEFEKNGLGGGFEMMAPFLNKQFLTEIAKKAILHNGVETINKMAPFIDSVEISEFIKTNFL